MTAASLLLVLAAAVLHAVWNLQAKRVKDGGAAFVWLCAALSALAYVPVAAVALAMAPPVWGVPQAAAVLGSGLLHLVYFLTLQRGYRVGDLSVVYPLARGTGPALSSLGAVLLLGERPSLPGALGAALVVVGVLLIAGGGRRAGAAGEPPTGDAARRRAGVLYGVLTGLLIAVYTLWDKRAVSAGVAVSPLLLDTGANLVRVALLAPLALRRRDEVALHWRRDRGPVLAVALLSPLAFILVLTALQTAPVSFVAPAREVSILIGVAFGARLLSEPAAPRRLAAAAVMLAGVGLLCLG